MEYILIFFNIGDIIKGLQQIDQNWWHGSHNGSSGIFPLTHVEELQAVPLAGHPTERPTHAAAASYVSDNSQQGDVIARGRANMDLTAQLNDELSFHKGDSINIIEILDADFAVGVCQGKKGSFPLSFIDIVEGSVEYTSKEVKGHSKFDWWKEAKQNNVITDNKTVLEYNGHNDISCEDSSTSSNTADQQISSPVKNAHNSAVVETPPITVDTSLFPPMDSLPSVPSWQSHRRNNSYNQQNTGSHEEGGITPYGKILFPFVGENPNELTVFDNEIVKLIRHVDDQWVEGEFEGKRGIFPASYVEIIVDCPCDYDAGPSCDSNNVIKQSSKSAEKTVETFGEDVFGCVLYDFMAENDGDLNLREGETIRLLGKINEDWYQGQTDDGHIGICPMKFIEVIPAEPPSLSTSSVINNGDASTLNEASRNSITPKPCEEQQQTPSKPSKPPILRPKPSLKGKPQSKSPTQSPVNDMGSGDKGKNVITINSDSMKTPYRPPRPSPTPLTKGFSPNSSLDDIIQKELECRKYEVGAISEPVPSTNSWVQHGDRTSDELPTAIQLECSTLSASYQKAPPLATMTSSSKPLVPNRPPPIPETKRLTSSSKKMPPPRPRANPTPQSLSIEPSVVDLGPRPIPQRAAPPRPAGQPVPTPRRKRSVDDLMEFSPDNTMTTLFTGL